MNKIFISSTVSIATPAFPTSPITISLSESNPLLDKIDTGHGWSQFEKQLEGKLINEVHVLEKTNMKSRSFLFFIASAGIICCLFIYLKCCNGKLNRRQRRRRKATPKRA